ncbi:hypothetical protein BD289DRAFT_145732 [Coniella lustricola]|uniref:Uncharacterized protein n=1 Tax=Coniella lustricola TaxID=2025994 RepID=A0A2T2ZV37_9PEZI|nr:hypothetical protein BD289DRAFT_145732 [Coniella lustricola]
MLSLSLSLSLSAQPWTIYFISCQMDRKPLDLRSSFSRHRIRFQNTPTQNFSLTCMHTYIYTYQDLLLLFSCRCGNWWGGGKWLTSRDNGLWKAIAQLLAHRPLSSFLSTNHGKHATHPHLLLSRFTSQQKEEEKQRKKRNKKEEKKRKKKRGGEGEKGGKRMVIASSICKYHLLCSLEKKSKGLSH